MQKYFAGSIGVMNAGNYRPLARIEMSSNPADHEVYLASEVDARIADLEKALRQTDCKCRQASETPYFYVPVVSYKCPRCAALSL